MADMHSGKIAIPHARIILQGILLLLSLSLAWTATTAQGVLLDLDFEADTPGQQPSGDWTFSPGSNTATNGSVVVDGTTDPANPLSGKSLYIYDQDGDGSSGTSTHMRGEINGGTNVAAVRASFNFQRMYAAADSDTRVHFTVGPAGYSLNNSDFRLFEVRILNDGSVVVEYSTDAAGIDGSRGSAVVGSYDTGNPNELVLFVNSNSTDAVAYDDGVLSGSLDPDMMDVYLNGSYIGTYLTIRRADTANAPQIDFWASDADLGQVALYQDSKRQGGIVFDNIRIEDISGGGGGGSNEPAVFLDLLDFESDTLGEQPLIPFATNFTPSSNNSTNGFVVVDAGTDPANPMPTGQALYAYDFTTGGSTHMRFDFQPANTDNVRVDFDFQRMYEVPPEDTDSRVHIAVCPAGLETNNSDFRPFELRLQNDGTLVVNYNPTGALQEGRDSEVVANYELTGANSVTFFANGNNGDSLPYDDETLGQGEVPPNTMVLFLNGNKLGEYGFINTPDPGNAPQIAFFESTLDFGRLGIYQDTSREGGIVFDNISIREFAKLGAPAAPANLQAVATGPYSVDLTWEDNSDNETGFVVEILNGSTWEELATADADATAYTVGGLEPSSEYTFRVRSTNGTLSAPSNEAAATTEEQLTPRILVQPEGGTTPAGTGLTLSVAASGPGTLSYQWYEGLSGDTSSPVDGAVDSVYMTPDLQASTSYWVRITNGNGSTDSDTATVEVFTPREIRVVSLAHLASILPDALPGDTYVLDNGTYPNAAIVFEGQGLENAPITLRAQTPGGVVLIGDSFLEIGGEWMVVEGLVFTNGWNQSRDQAISFRAGGSRPASNCRVTQCAIIDYSPPESSTDRDWIGIYGTRNRFDHNLISGHGNFGVTLVVWRSPGKLDEHRIDHNHFRNRASGGGENGWETIRIGTSGDSLSDSGCVVEYNLFEACDGEIEIISNKSGDNTYRYNTFWRSQGMLTLRHGNHCLVEGNIFMGEGVSSSGGIRVIGEDHVIINNYIERTAGREGGAIAVYAGVPDSALNQYYAAHNAYLANNTIVDVQGAHFNIGAGYGSSSRTVLPTGVVVENNLSARWRQTTGSFSGPVSTGDAVADATWTGNMADGVTAGTATGGISSVTVPWQVGPDGLLRPMEGSPVIDAGVANSVGLDLDGQNRQDLPDVGADEVVTTSGLNPGGPLLPVEVGPLWRERVDSTVPWHGPAVGAGSRIDSPVFGSFTVLGMDWIAHAEKGLLQVAEVDDTTSMWMYSTVLRSWIWSSNACYPILYDTSRASWVHFVTTDRGTYLYDYGTGLWEQVP